MKVACLAPVSSRTCNYQYLSCLMFFFLSFLNLTSVCLLIVGVEVYCCPLSHSMTHTRWDSSGWRIGPKQKPIRDNTPHPQDTDILAPGGIRIWDLHIRPRSHWVRPVACTVKNLLLLTALWYRTVCVQQVRHVTDGLTSELYIRFVGIMTLVYYILCLLDFSTLFVFSVPKIRNI
jgi:hypothetical protein